MNTFTGFYINGIGEALGWTILHSLWQGLIIFIILSIGFSILRNHRPEIRYHLALMGLMALAVWSGFTFVDAISELPARSETYEMADAGWAMAEAEGSFGIQTWSAAKVNNLISTALNPFLPWIAVIWGAGFLFFTARWIGGMTLVQRLRRHGSRPVAYEWHLKVKKLADRVGITRKVDLVESFRVHVPMVIGHLKPLILIPAGMLNGISPSQFEAIIVHELAHIRRNDYLLNLLFSLMEALFFYHPAYWWIAGKVHVEREHCCDDMAVRICGDPISYARVLSDLEAQKLQKMAFAMGLGDKKKHLLHRIQRLVLPGSVDKANSNRLLLVMMLVFFTGIAWLSPDSKNALSDLSHAIHPLEENLTAAIPSIPGMIGYLSQGTQSPAKNIFSEDQEAEMLESELRDLDLAIRRMNVISMLSDTPPPAPDPPLHISIPEMPELPEFPQLPEINFSFDESDTMAMQHFKEAMTLYKESQREWKQEFDAHWENYAAEIKEWASNFSVQEYEDQQKVAMEKYQRALEQLELQKEKERYQRERALRNREETLRRMDAARERDDEAMIREKRQLQEMLDRQAEMQERQELLRQEKMIRQEEQKQRMVEEKLRLTEEKLQREVELQQQEVERELKAMERRMKAKERNMRNGFEELKKFFIKEGIVSADVDKLKIKVMDDSVKVNGRKLSDQQYKTYKAILRKYNIDLGSGSNVQYQPD